MSKSLGNIIDPLDIINEYGTDALRFSLISITSQGQDIFLSREKFEQGRNFANKIWNASRFILMNLDPDLLKVDLCVLFKNEDLSITNRWILSRFYSTLKEVTKYLENFQFNEAANSLYAFFWHDFCDWYLELAKPILVNREQRIENRNTQVVMYKVLEKFLRILHPFMPFITEEVWQKLNGPTSIMIQPWPHIEEQIIDKKIENKMNKIFEIITTIRNMRQELEIPIQTDITAVISTANKENKHLVEMMSLNIKNLAKLKNLSIEDKYRHIKSSINSLIKDIHITVPLSGIVELEKEKIRLQERIHKIESEIKAKQKTLSNREFLKKAPEEIVEKERARLKELDDISKRLKIVKDGLQ